VRAETTRNASFARQSVAKIGRVHFESHGNVLGFIRENTDPCGTLERLI